MDQQLTSPEKYNFALVSGGFDPLHVGHIHLINDAANYADKVLILLNSDEWLVKKKNYFVMKAPHRKLILENMKTVSYVHVQTADDSDMSSSAAIADIVSILRKCSDPTYRFCFCNGGDRNSDKDIREADICRSLEVDLLYGVGGNFKADSSSTIIDNAIRREMKNTLKT